MNNKARVGRWRITEGPMASGPEDGLNGAFVIPFQGSGLRVISSDGSGWDMPPPAWEHVSVSLSDRCPTWEEMDHIKRIFFNDNETVVQFHVPRSDHINVHPFCLHLWRPLETEIPLPPKITVAPEGFAGA